MSIPHVPQLLDGATVLFVAPASAGQIGYSYETGDPVAVHYYAIAQYVGDQPRAYLFAASADHQVVGDSLWDSPDEAVEIAIKSANISGRFEPPT